MKKYIILSLTTSAIIMGGNLLSSVAFAQTETTTPTVTTPETTSPFATRGENHPRVDQVEKRIENQENRIKSAEQAGKITPEQAQRDQNRLDKQKEQLKANEAEHGGHITAGEKKKLNGELNRNNEIGRRQANHERHERRERKERREQRQEKREKRQQRNDQHKSN